MIQKQKTADVMTDHLCCVKQFELCTTTAKITPEGDLFPPEEASKGAPSQLPVLPPHPAPPRQVPSGPSDRRREIDRKKACSLTHRQPFIVKRRAVLRHNTFVCSRAAQFIVVALLSGRLQGRRSKSLKNIGLCAGSTREEWITLHSLKKKKNCSYPLVEWMRITPRGSR